jgi:hypothetical protein
MPIKKSKTGKTPDGRGTVTYYSNDGRKIKTHVGGTRAWRNNNPGNITWKGREKQKGAFADRHGAIGSDGTFAIFPNVETGRLARNRLLEGPSYRDRTLNETIEKYDSASGPKEREQYKKNISQWTGIRLDRKLGDLTTAERNALYHAMERQEGFTNKDGSIKYPGKVINHTKGRKKLDSNSNNGTLNDTLRRSLDQWSEEDVTAVHREGVRLGPENPKGRDLLKRVGGWYEHFYGGGSMKSDATGRMISPKPVRPIPVGGGSVHVRAYTRSGDGKTVQVDAYDRSAPSR